MGTAKTKVLIVEDEERFRRLFRASIDGHAVVLTAETIDGARRLFLENPDVSIIAFDGSVPVSAGTEADPSHPAAVSLVQEILASGYRGVLVAISTRHNAALVEAGCTYQREKHEFPQLVFQLLGVE